MTEKKLEKESKYNAMDANQDGIVSDAEIDNWQQSEEVKRQNRKQLVGLVPVDKTLGIEEGQHVIEQKDLSLPIKDTVDMLGHVTSSYFSPNLNHSVAMALIRGGKRKIGSRLFVSTENLNTIAVEVVEPNFIDPKNERMML